jgi:hypothetical protein
MQLWSVLGQYLLLSFVLPGFCYLAAFYLCFPGTLGRVFPGVLGEIRPGVPLDANAESPEQDGEAEGENEDDEKETDEKEGGKKEASQGFWITMLAGLFGLLLSSVAFFVETILRNLIDFDCKRFTRIPFDKLADPDNPLANFLAAEAFMHFNIGVGILIILGVWIGVRGKSIWSGPYLCDPKLLAVGLVVVIVSNLVVSSHLFARTAVAAYKSELGAQTAKDACEKSRR